MAKPSDSAPKNVDKRTFRKQFRTEIHAGITSLRSKVAPPARMSDALVDDPSCKICVRKRPIFEHEVKSGEYDVVTCNGPYNVIVHDARMYPDCKRAFINNIDFPFHRVFDEQTTNASVFEETVQPLVDLGLQGGKAVAFMFGQTGSGKTHTMTAMQDMAAARIFDSLPDGASIAVSMFEIAGTNSVDLLNGRAQIAMRDDGKGRFLACGLSEVPCENAEDIVAALNHGRNLRATESTDINSVSSRSHAISVLRVIRPGMGIKGRPKIGEVMLVDLAGSERKEDSMFHNADRRREGAAINASLMALKECIRLRGAPAGTRVPYRDSILTQVLKEALEPGNCTATTVIATISPSATDTEHTTNTLRHVAVMAGAEAAVAEVKGDVNMELGPSFEQRVPTAPNRWNSEEVREWLQTVRGGAYKDALDRLPSGFTGAQLVKMGPAQFSRLAGSAPAGDKLRKIVQDEVKKAKLAREEAARASRATQAARKSGTAPSLPGKENVRSTF